MGKGPTFTRYTRMGDIAHATATAAQQALAWFKRRIQSLAGSTLPEEIREDDTKTQEEQIAAAIKAGIFKPVDYQSIGQMFLFKYDPKWKNRLQYWDVFPLCIPIGTFKGGFIGLNLHYLPMGFRVPIINHLSTYSHDSDKYDDQGRLDISYDILKNSFLFQHYQACVRKYLYTQVRSRFEYVSPKDWQHVGALPLERWEYRK